MTGNPNCGRTDLLPESLVGALRLFLDEVEEEAEFEARFGRPLKDLTIDELCAATYGGTTIGENWPKRPQSDCAPGSSEPGYSCAEANRLVTPV
ncbi:hypothetical protein JXD38_11430 [candidate division WOR-3 bacterium]|nr:hypothetical protein [candidate division WOR-3 bacterium]